MAEWKIGYSDPWQTEVVDANGMMMARCIGDDHQERAALIAKAVNMHQNRRRRPVAAQEATSGR